MSINKNDATARQHFGWDNYQAIPKSVFALMAYHLAAALSGQCDNPAAARKRMIEEIDALEANGFVTAAQAKSARKALAAAH